MSPELIGLVGMASLFVLLGLRVPVIARTARQLENFADAGLDLEGTAPRNERVTRLSRSSYWSP